MSPELLSVHGAVAARDLSEADLIRLSRWEAVNFFSLSVHGIRELMQSVLQSIYTPGYEIPSTYFHHFIGEENGHMWFFAEFCLRYGDKIYESKRLKFSSFSEPDIQQFVAFAQILIFEMIGDFYNLRMQSDDRLPAIVRQINRVHHADECRHIAMGCEVVRLLHRDLRRRHPDVRLREVTRYLKNYLATSMESFYNVTAYRDAGRADAYGLRRRLLADPARRAWHQRVTRNVVRLFEGAGIFEREERDDQGSLGLATGGD